MFTFKLIAIQEYVHIEQHKQEKVHQDNCQVCHTIFQVGKFQTFDAPDISDFNITSLPNETSIESGLYIYQYVQKIDSSELYNRPPPAIS